MGKKNTAAPQDRRTPMGVGQLTNNLERGGGEEGETGYTPEALFPFRIWPHCKYYGVRADGMLN